MNRNEIQERTYAFPYGLTYIAPAVCTFFGMLFFHIAAFGCSTFRSEFSDEATFGYFKSGVGDSKCDSYDTPSDLPGVFRFGRFIGVVGSLLIWVVVAFVATAGFFRFPRPELVFSGVAIAMVVLSLFSFLLLSGNAAEEFNIKIGPGGVLAIFSAFLWFGGAIAVVRFMKERVRTTASTTPVQKASAGPGDPTNRIDDDDAEFGVEQK